MYRRIFCSTVPISNDISGVWGLVTYVCIIQPKWSTSLSTWTWMGWVEWWSYQLRCHWVSGARNFSVTFFFFLLYSILLKDGLWSCIIMFHWFLRIHNVSHGAITSANRLKHIETPLLVEPKWSFFVISLGPTILQCPLEPCKSPNAEIVRPGFPSFWWTSTGNASRLTLKLTALMDFCSAKPERNPTWRREDATMYASAQASSLADVCQPSLRGWPLAWRQWADLAGLACILHADWVIQDENVR